MCPLAIGSRWETHGQPDTSGEQLRVLQDFLRSPAGQKIRLVWYDHWSMAQAPRSPRDQVEFDHMLWRVDWLFLASPVLILLDLSYLSRFWVCERLLKPTD